MQHKKLPILLMIFSILFSTLILPAAHATTPLMNSLDRLNVSGAYGIAYHDGYIYAAQRGQNKIVRISTSTGDVSDVTASGVLSSPMAIALNSQGDLFYTQDSNKSIYKIPAASLTSLPLSSADVTRLRQVYHTAAFTFLYGMAFDAADNLYFASVQSKVIYKLVQDQEIPIVSSTSRSFRGMGFDPSGNLYFIDDTQHIYKINQADILSKAENDPTKYQDLGSLTGSLNYIAFLPDGTHYINNSSVIQKHVFPADAANNSIAAAKALLPESMTISEDMFSNLLNYLKGLPGMTDTGVTLTLTSANPNVANNGNVTYTNAAVSGNVVVSINKTNGTQATQSITVNVLPHTPTPAELDNAAIAAAKALLPQSMTVTEDTYTNLLTYLSELPDMEATGVTLTLTSSNPNVANNGDITYSNETVSGNVVVSINKTNGTQATQSITVIVLPHTPTPAELDNAAIAAAKALLPEIITVTGAKGEYTNLLTFLSKLPYMATTGVTLTLTSSNPNVANNGDITYSNGTVSGYVVVHINKANGTEATATIAVNVQTIDVVIPDVMNAAYSASPTSVTLTWASPSTAKGIKIVDGNGTVVTLTSANSYTFTELSPATAYSFTIIVLGENNTESSGVTVTAYTSPVPTPELPVITALTADLSEINLVVGGTTSATVTATYSDQTKADVTRDVAWKSDNTEVVSVSSEGVMTANSVGSSFVTGTLDGQTVRISVMVTAKSLAVDPASASIYLGGNKQLKVTASYSNQITADVTASASYTSSNDKVASVSAQGVITAVGYGSANITVAFGGQKQIVAVTVPKPSLGEDSPAPTTPESKPSTEEPVKPVQPSEPALSPAPPKTPDVFKREVVVSDESIVNRLQSKLEEAKESGVATAFPDTTNHWAKDTIDLFVKLKVIEGYGDGKFKPDGQITRAEFSVIIDRVFNIGGGDKKQVVLNDISKHWAKTTIEKLANAGVLNGYGQDFRPNQTITRAEMVVIISRIVNMSAVQNNGANTAFSDIGQSFASEQIKEAAAAGIITGKGGNHFDPSAPSTRAEALTVILNTLNLNPQIKTLLEAY